MQGRLGLRRPPLVHLRTKEVGFRRPLLVDLGMKGSTFNETGLERQLGYRSRTPPGLAGWVARAAGLLGETPLRHGKARCRFQGEA